MYELNINCSNDCYCTVTANSHVIYLSAFDFYLMNPRGIYRSLRETFYDIELFNQVMECDIFINWLAGCHWENPLCQE